MNTMLLKSPSEINMDLAGRVRDIRKRRKISQESLASKSGVRLGSLKRFESTGQISLISFTKICLALGLENEIEALFCTPEFTNIEEIINGQGK